MTASNAMTTDLVGVAVPKFFRSGSIFFRVGFGGFVFLVGWPRPAEGGGKFSPASQGESGFAAFVLERGWDF
jgi:hypothetical protein